MSTKPGFAIDFDGVIYQRPKSERGNLDFSAEPVPGAMNFVRHSVSAFKVYIFSTRFNDEIGGTATESVEKAKDWMSYHMAQENIRQTNRGKPSFDAVEIVRMLTFTALKPMARIYLDDRAIRFDGVFPSIKELIAFKTYEGR